MEAETPDWIKLGAIGGWGAGLYDLFNGGNRRNGGGHPHHAAEDVVTQKELSMMQSLSEKDAAIAALTAGKETDAKLTEVYRVIDRRFNEVEKQLGAQAVVNAQLAGTVNGISQGLNGVQTILNSITKLIVPKEAICPEVMPRYNSWTAPTDAAAANGSGTANNG